MRAADRSGSDPRLTDAIGLALAVAAMAACVTLVFLGMRAVMDVGGACADGGPYVSAQPCPDGVAAAMFLGIFGLFGSGALVWRYGSRIGEPFESLPFLAWPALFCSLGWNFLEYGLFAPPEGAGIIWSWLIPGILFELMGLVPLWGWIVAMRYARSAGSAGSAGSAAGTVAKPLPGPRQPTRPPRPSTVAAAPAARKPTTAREAALSGLAASFGAAATLTAAQAKLGGGRAGADDLEGGPAAALVDRLEKLAHLREEGLLEDREYEAAKSVVLHELDTLA
jgi:hypothetical protein